MTGGTIGAALPAGLLWRLLETNPAFRAEFVTSPKGLSIVAALLHHMQCVRKRAAQYGFLCRSAVARPSLIES